jgi:hypothetical protein
MNQFSAMRMFAKVAESLSFTVAAKELRVSTAMVTRSVATLETYLNLRGMNTGRGAGSFCGNWIPSKQMCARPRAKRVAR